ncbi:hypothetical protein [Chryseobacterium taihuense]|uniref:hypothetical protein n=1 Tax=Chryseobacterium taihuense TaxID=1141221 RepID=UPI00115FFB9A|nr:hypothetical protein [Chryseobacterium taihuense]
MSNLFLKLIGGIQVQGKSKPLLVNSSPTDSIERFSFYQPFGVSASAFTIHHSPITIHQSPITIHLIQIFLPLNQ